jgi:uncharacterized protein GlcG (DUF336 family)
MKRLRGLLLGALSGIGFAAAIAGCPSGGASNDANYATSGVALSQADVDRIMVAAVSEAQARGSPAAIAVTDREGEVLGVFVMTPRDVNGDGVLDAVTETNIQTAIAKAATASAFQSEGEAFTTRTAFFIVQGHYPPNVTNTPAGPLFGVQDSGLASSDAKILAYDQAGNGVGLGLSGEVGGVALYKQGSPVGGIGVDTVDAVVSRSSPTDSRLSPTLATPIQNDLDEAIARAGVQGFETPAIIQATNVFVGGIAFPFYGDTFPSVVAPIAAIVSSIPASVGAVDPRFPLRASPLAPEIYVSGRYGLRPTQRYIGRIGARIAANFSGTFTNIDRPATVAFDPSTFTFTGVPILPTAEANAGSVPSDIRLPSIDAIEPPPAEGGLAKADVDAIIGNSADNARLSVAGIRLPRGSSVTVHIAVVDVRGNILGVTRMGDGTLFSYDVAVQKARTAAFFSSDGSGGVPALAMTARAIGFIAQPFFPPGIDGTEAGPLVRLRDLLNRGRITIEVPPVMTTINPPPRLPSDGTTDENAILGGFQTFDDFGGNAPVPELGEIRAIQAGGGFPLLADRPDTTPAFVSPGLQSGMMTFPGGCPLYRAGKLIGAVGVSGDGVDEDDQAAYSGTAGYEPPAGARVDEASDSTIQAVLTAKINLIVAAINGHPDPRIRRVYGPIVTTQQGQILTTLSHGFQGVRIPFVKFPRNSSDF